MKNNKGFTLLELLAILIVLALITIITIPAIGNIQQNAKKIQQQNLHMDI